jgi:hypothetical protein
MREHSGNQDEHLKVTRIASRAADERAGSVTRLSTTPYSCVCNCASRQNAPLWLLHKHQLCGAHTGSALSLTFTDLRMLTTLDI